MDNSIAVCHVLEHMIRECLGPPNTVCQTEYDKEEAQAECPKAEPPVQGIRHCFCSERDTAVTLKRYLPRIRKVDSPDQHVL